MEITRLSPQEQADIVARQRQPIFTLIGGADAAFIVREEDPFLHRDSLGNYVQCSVDPDCPCHQDPAFAGE